jgi:methionine-rich copper-binding protein CopC
MNRYLLIPVTLLVMLVAACAPASTTTSQPAAAPTAGAMMENQTPTTEAMMAQGTGTPNAMMESGTGTPNAMMESGTGTPGAMMEPATGTPGAMMSQGTPTAGTMMNHLPDQVKTAHFVDSSPKQGDQFAHAPDKVVVNFDAALAEGSTLAATRDSSPVDVGKPTVSDKTLSATLPMAGPGVYVVNYKACFSGGMCDNGQFAFAVNAQ